MTPSLAAGLVLCLGLPFMYRRLRRSAEALDGFLTVVAAGGTEGSPSAAAQTRPALIPLVRLVEEAHPPDRQPDVTPLMAKAGSVRRVESAPPCHDCTCCRTYSVRLHRAHEEIDQLRREVEAGDAQRINRGIREA